MSDELDVQKYKRGNSRPLRNVKDKKLRGQLKSLDERFKAAAKSAAATDYLLLEEKGYLEAEGDIEKTFKVSQKEIKESVDVSTQKKRFDLNLPTFGPYCADYSLTGNSLVLGGQKGHIAAFDWKQGKLSTELNVNETVRAVKWLQSDNQFFAVAQKKYTYIYDAQGTEVHALKRHIEATKLEYLPYHFLLASAGNTGYIKYQDVSTGQLVAELKTKLGSTSTLTQNPYNAVLHAGHANGTVTLWAPSMPDPLVKLLTSRGPVRALAIDRSGTYMAAAGTDKSLKIWDVRTFKELESYYTPTAASSLHISDSGLLAVGWGPHVQIWKDVLTKTGPKQSAPYMNHLIPGSQINTVRFCPFEDVLGLGHAQGFSSIVVPGSGEANFDSLEINPYANATRVGRRETEVRSLLNKLRPEMIALDPNAIGTVDKRSNQERLKPAELEALAERQQGDQESKLQPRISTKGKNSAIRKHLRKKTQNVIDERKLRIEAALKREKQLRQRKHNERLGLEVDKDAGAALSRFG
ncbi:Utp7p [Sugiyamaella lignohabitans]|uniref:U three protein 7 n=1 Tax=Sugiyamaella lignohabitans TaxID=796027 RepID=A0A167FVZ8_9ASCO|nr:Utp7p [Sugiyamaella lignohabitans]ANB15769.1 Utp7p [Sugiyamaella lignohabitans]